MKKALMVVLCVLMLGSLAGIAQATWYTCTVNQAGTSGTAYFCNLTDTASPSTWTTNPQNFFIATNGNEKSMLASMLTAWSTGGKVQVWLEYPGAWWTLTAATVSN